MAKLQSDGTAIALGAGDAASVAYGSDTFSQVIGDITDITLGGMTKGLTAFGDLNDTVEQYKPHLMATIGDTTMTVEYDASSTGIAALITAFDAGTLKWFRVTLADSTVLYASAYVTGIDPIEISRGEKVTRSFTLRTTIKWTTP